MDGLKVWMAGDLGGDFSAGQMDWAVLHFEPGTTPEQKKAAEAIIHQVFPVRWKSFTVGADLPIVWKQDPDRPKPRSTAGRPRR